MSNLSYIPFRSAEVQKREQTLKLKAFDTLRATLIKWNLPHSLDDIFNRITQGADYERRMACEQMEEYFKRAGVPKVLWEEQLKTAYESVPEEQVEEISICLSRLENGTRREDLEEDKEGNIRLTAKAVKGEIEALRTTVPDEVAKWYDDVKKFTELYWKLDDRFNMPMICETLGFGPLVHTDDICSVMMDSFRGEKK